LLEYGRAVTKKLAHHPPIQKAARPTLFHPDLHKRNIFVSEQDPKVITAIIDWQAASVEPAFWYADETPDFAQPVPDPADEEQVEPKSEACAKAFPTAIQILTPKLAAARSMDESLFRPFRYCYRTWVDGAAAFREELIQTSRHWKELGLAGTCPYPLPSLDELGVHQKNYRFFEAAQQMRQNVPDLLNSASDGWVPSADFEATEQKHQELFKALLQEIVDNEDPDDDEPLRSEDDVREVWPFDLKE
jgi:hypothetical protein